MLGMDYEISEWRREMDTYIYIYTFELFIIHGTNGARKIWFQDRRKIKLGEREKSQS